VSKTFFQRVRRNNACVLAGTIRPTVFYRNTNTKRTRRPKGPVLIAGVYMEDHLHHFFTTKQFNSCTVHFSTWVSSGSQPFFGRGTPKSMTETSSLEESHTIGSTIWRPTDGKHPVSVKRIQKYTSTFFAHYFSCSN